MTANILVYDIETAPLTGNFWGLWQQNISLAQLMDSGYIMSYAAKWLGEDKVLYEEARKNGKDKSLVKKLHKLLDRADIVVAHNGKSFDDKWVLGRCAVHGLLPPSPFKSVDTLAVSRSKFRLPSHKLEYLLDIFGCSKKLKHKKFAGFELWSECMSGNPEAWEEMRAYNIQDVVGLEELYVKLLPWIGNHPNLSVYSSEEEVQCGGCESKNIHYRGYAYTNASKFKRFQCQDCGKWGRLKTTELTKEKRQSLGANVAGA